MDTNQQIMSIVIANQEDKLSDYAIGDKQLIFVRDKHKIALDFNGIRTFYNQIEVLDSESERQAIESPLNGLFYFVCNTAILWYYNNGWICIASPSNNAVFIGTLLPETGDENKLYVNKQNREISVWDTENATYITVAEKNDEISEAEIASLFS